MLSIKHSVVRKINEILVLENLTVKQNTQIGQYYKNESSSNTLIYGCRAEIKWKEESSEAKQAAFTIPKGIFCHSLVFRKVDGEMIWEASDSLTQKKVNCHSSRIIKKTHSVSP